MTQKLRIFVCFLQQNSKALAKHKQSKSRQVHNKVEKNKTIESISQAH